jgi:nitrate reductase beta subunit
MKHAVYNRQLNREMRYKYPESRPEKQIAWVFDTNKCIACQTCTIACKNAWTAGKGQESMWWNNVETKPWGFYPLGWDVRLLEMLGGQKWDGDRYVGQTIFEKVLPGEKHLGWLPDEEDYQYPNIGEDEVNQTVKQGEYIRIPHQPWMFYLARICNHCTYPACLSSCPRNAIYKRDDGIVLIDQKRCRGYQECIRACPYKKTFFRKLTGKSEKCIGCYPAVEQGQQTQCVNTCIGKIRISGYLSQENEPRADNPIDYLVHIRKIALPLYPQFGTEPNVYYIPPIHVPDEFNRQLFGPGAKRSTELYTKAYDDEKLVGLLMLFVSTDRIIHSFKVKNALCYGYDDQGVEVVKVPLKEPIVVRKAYDRQRDVHRISVS